MDSVSERVGLDERDLTDDRDLLTRCQVQVPAPQRMWLVLRSYDDLSASEVATVLGISEGTVKVADGPRSGDLRVTTSSGTTGRVATSPRSRAEQD